PDPVAAHLARRVAERLVAVVQRDLEHAARVRLDDFALELDLLFLSCQSVPPSCVCRVTNDRAPGEPGARERGGLGDLGDVDRLGAFCPFAGLELDLRALGEGLEALAADVAEVHEEILPTLVRGDEAVALRVVEPLHRSSSHGETPPLPVTNA